MIKYIFFKLICFKCSIAKESSSLAGATLKLTEAENADQLESQSCSNDSDFDRKKMVALDLDNEPHHISKDTTIKQDCADTNDAKFTLESHNDFDEKTKSDVTIETNRVHFLANHKIQQAEAQAKGVNTDFSVETILSDKFVPLNKEKVSSEPLDLSMKSQRLTTVNKFDSNKEFTTDPFISQCEKKAPSDKIILNKETMNLNQPTQYNFDLKYYLQQNPNFDPLFSLHSAQSRKRGYEESDATKNNPVVRNPIFFHTSFSFEPHEKKAAIFQPSLNTCQQDINPYSNTNGYNTSYNSSSFLVKFNSFLQLVESLLYVYLKERLENEEIDINKLIYSPKLSILQQFSSVLFGVDCITPSDTLKMASSTADMLNSFIGSLDFEKSKEIILSLESCLCYNISQPLTENILASKIKDEIIEYLKSEESTYLKSICTEFHSFINFFNVLQVRDSFDVVKGFIAFLMLVKRNVLITPILKKNVKKQRNAKLKIILIFDEVLYSSVFFFVFTNYWPFVNPGFILTNIKASIFLSCVKKRLGSGRLTECGEILFIHRHLIFYFKDFKLSLDPALLPGSSLDFFTKRRIQRKLRNYISKAMNLIESIKPSLVAKVYSDLEAVYFKHSSHRDCVFNILKDHKDINIHKLTALLNLTLTLNVYRDCNINHAISIYLRSFYDHLYNLNRKATSKL